MREAKQWLTIRTRHAEKGIGGKPATAPAGCWGSLRYVLEPPRSALRRILGAFGEKAVGAASKALQHRRRQSAKLSSHHSQCVPISSVP